MGLEVGVEVPLVLLGAVAVVHSRLALPLLVVLPLAVLALPQTLV